MHGKHEGGGPECDSRDGWRGAHRRPASSCFAVPDPERGEGQRPRLLVWGEGPSAHQVLKVIQVPEVSGCR